VVLSVYITHQTDLANRCPFALRGCRRARCRVRIRDAFLARIFAARCSCWYVMIQLLAYPALRHRTRILPTHHEGTYRQTVFVPEVARDTDFLFARRACLSKSRAVQCREI
jgi:hypothetical protein